MGCNHGMPCLVIRGNLLFFFGEEMTFSFRAQEHFLNRLNEVVLRDYFSVVACGKYGGFIKEICEVRSGKSRGAFGNLAQFYLFGYMFFSSMNFQYCFTVVDIGRVEHDAAVKPPRAQKRGIENIRSVGCRNHNNIVFSLKSIHLDKNLIERLFALVMPSSKSGTALSSHRINLVDKDNCRGIFLCGFKEVPYS